MISVCLCHYFAQLINTIIDGGLVEIKFLRKLFEEGLLMTAKVVPAPMESDKWILVFIKASGGLEQITKARDRKDKIYKRINGAILDAKTIGFKEVVVTFT